MTRFGEGHFFLIHIANQARAVFFMMRFQLSSSVRIFSGIIGISINLSMRMRHRHPDFLATIFKDHNVFMLRVLRKRFKALMSTSRLSGKYDRQIAQATSSYAPVNTGSLHTDRRTEPYDQRSVATGSGSGGSAISAGKSLSYLCTT